MHAPAEGKYVSVQEAAEILGVRREHVAHLLRDGILTWKPNMLDRRQRLIPRDEIEHLLEEGHRSVPRSQQDAEVSRKSPDSRADESYGSVDGGGFPRRGPRPKSIGMISDGSLPARDSEQWIRDHWGKE